MREPMDIRLFKRNIFEKLLQTNPELSLFSINETAGRLFEPDKPLQLNLLE